MALKASVTTVVATTASVQRAHTIKRAIGSIRASSVLPVQVVVVVNGKTYDRGICDWLEKQPDLRLEFLHQPSLTAALSRGRQLVDSEFFSFLDDDDEYLPNSLDHRQKLLQDDPAVDVVASNGYRHVDGVDSVAFRRLGANTNEPLSGLLRGVWLCSCNGTFRTESISQRYFDDMHERAEWTWLAFNLALDKRSIAALDMPTFRIHDTLGSLSKSREYREAYLSLFERMVDKNPPAHVAHLIKRQVSAAWHDRSVHALSQGDRFDALRAHARSVFMPGGIRYLSYSWRLIRGY